MSLTTPISVQKLQTALHAKAKEAPKFRFHALYDKVYRKDVLTYAYERCEANGGAAGVDEQTFEDIAKYGRERWLDELTQELKSRTYQPKPVRRVYIPKPDGKQRPLAARGASLDSSDDKEVRNPQAEPIECAHGDEQAGQRGAARGDLDRTHGVGESAGASFL